MQYLIEIISFFLILFFPETTTLLETSAAPSTHMQTLSAIRVIDGDTLKIASSESTLTIRVIGINTPETKDPRKPVECFGQEASQKMTELVQGQTVTLIADPSQTDRDRYDRLLRYVELSDGRDVGEILIREGYAQEYTYNSPYARQTIYREAEQEARDNQRGLWSPDTCPGYAE
ncbi:thermonuclease family protein [Candidatus Woesebacteria bacterium]|nr:thermonuclease family protein [Candidatus Woesebacteria bacterium]MCD8506890.1 thermonuclease family protein [Candidatus Woesebacteria bacterium]MCD8527491.1 thermonuclease family protein [Candidatus Woesebacteria bacterium]MCD8546232.1 thermonuclease family protein [Candidatus Woesebacteria bacterium]